MGGVYRCVHCGNHREYKRGDSMKTCPKCGHLMLRERRDKYGATNKQVAETQENSQNKAAKEKEE